MEATPIIHDVIVVTHGGDDWPQSSGTVGTHGPGQVEYVWSRGLLGSVHLDEGGGEGRVGLYLLIDTLYTQ